MGITSWYLTKSPKPQPGHGSAKEEDGEFCITVDPVTWTVDLVG